MSESAAAAALLHKLNVTGADLSQREGAKLREELCDAYYSCGSYKEALPHLVDAVRIWESYSDSRSLSRCYNKIGTTLHSYAESGGGGTGADAKAIAAVEKKTGLTAHGAFESQSKFAMEVLAEALASGIKSKASEARLSASIGYLNAAALYLLKNDMKAAGEAIGTAIAIVIDDEGEEGTKTTQDNQNQDESQEQQQEEQEFKPSSHLAFCYSMEGTMYMCLSEYENALLSHENDLKHSVASANNNNDNDNEDDDMNMNLDLNIKGAMRARFNITLCNMKLKRFTKALTVAKEAGEVAKADPDNHSIHDVALNSYNIAVCYYGKSEYESAITTLLQAKEIAESTFDMKIAITSGTAADSAAAESKDGDTSSVSSPRPTASSPRPGVSSPRPTVLSPRPAPVVAASSASSIAGSSFGDVDADYDPPPFGTAIGGLLYVNILHALALCLLQNQEQSTLLPKPDVVYALEIINSAKASALRFKHKTLSPLLDCNILSTAGIAAILLASDGSSSDGLKDHTKFNKIASIDLEKISTTTGTATNISLLLQTLIPGNPFDERSATQKKYIKATAMRNHSLSVMHGAGLGNGLSSGVSGETLKAEKLRKTMDAYKKEIDLWEKNETKDEAGITKGMLGNVISNIGVNPKDSIKNLEAFFLTAKKTNNKSMEALALRSIADLQESGSDWKAVIKTLKKYEALVAILNDSALVLDSYRKLAHAYMMVSSKERKEGDVPLNDEDFARLSNEECERKEENDPVFLRANSKQRSLYFLNKYKHADKFWWDAKACNLSAMEIEEVEWQKNAEKDAAAESASIHAAQQQKKKK
jgi:tetratricopeptide (TPR) repeat protein